MSNLLVTPELVAAAAADLAGIGSAIGAANAAAGAPTMALLAAGADEVSAAVAAVFSSYAQQYQTASAAAAAFHDQFTRTLLAGAGAYAGAEAANVEQQLLNAINAPTLALLGRPLIGNGAAAALPAHSRPSAGPARPAGAAVPAVRCSAAPARPARTADPWLAPIFARSTLRHSHHLGGIAQTGAVADQQGQIAGLGRAGRQ